MKIIAHYFCTLCGLRLPAWAGPCPECGGRVEEIE